MAGLGVFALLAVACAVYAVAAGQIQGLAIPGALLVLAVAQPLAGVVFVLDGVLIGAGDVRYLAITGVVNLACYLPLLWWVVAAGTGGAGGLAWLSAAFFGGYLAARAITLGLRAAGAAWQR